MNGGLLRVESLELLAGLAAFLAFAMITKRPRPAALAESSEGSLVELEIQSPGGNHVSRVPLPLTLGRTSQASIVLPDAMVSRVHARIDAAGGRAFIEDLESRNGTFLNGKEVKRARLEPGDEIVLGSTRIRFHGAGAAEWT